MSIRIKYKGNIGNHLFQYVYARQLADRNDLYLETPFPYQSLLQTTPHKRGKKYSEPKIYFEEPLISKEAHEHHTLIDQNEIFLFYDNLNKPFQPGQYILDGYFEYAELFNMNEQLIKSYFQLGSIEKNTEDIVMNVRLGDFCQLGRVIDSQWYLNILEKEIFKKLFIVGGEADDPYLTPFLKFNPVIIPTDPVNDFHFLRKFDKIICSNSTYCWWAAFLSEASKIYISDRWLSPILRSCKNSILIKAKYIDAYKPASDHYLPVYSLIASKDTIKLALDNFIDPRNDQIKKLANDCLEIIYNDLRRNPQVPPCVVHLNFESICRFSMTFYCGGSLLTPGSSFLADYRVNFADWKSFHDWIFFGLRGLANLYLTENGNGDIIGSKFNLEVNQKKIENIFNQFVKDAPFINYIEPDELQKKAVSLLNENAILLWFDKKEYGAGSIYILVNEIEINPQWRQFFKRYKEGLDEFFSIDMKDDTTKEASKFHKALSMTTDKTLSISLFGVNYKKVYLKLTSIENCIRLFAITQADYLILNPFIAQRRRF